MSSLFVDTGAWVAMNNARDKFHAQAQSAVRNFGRHLTWVTTNYILDETYTLLLSDIGYERAVAVKQVMDLLQKQEKLIVVWVDELLADNAWDIFERFNHDKAWSFTDCVSYAVMQRERLTNVFAFDHHFQQMGFTLSA